MKTKLILVFCVFFCIACNDGGLYYTVNPPLDGVVVEGDPNTNVTGFYIGAEDPSSPNPNLGGSEDFLSLSNGSFGTFSVPVSHNFLSQSASTARYGIQIVYNNTDVIYVYKRNGQNLERDNAEYKNGVYPDGSEYNLMFLYNEVYQDVLVRGVIPFTKTFMHDLDYLYIYLQLKTPIRQGETLKVCAGEFDPNTGTILNPDCLNVTIP